MKSSFKFIGYFVAFAILSFVIIQIDIAANPWLLQAAHTWKWYNYFMSYHGLAILYLNGCGLWLIAPLLATIGESIFVHLFKKRGY